MKRLLLTLCCLAFSTALLSAPCPRGAPKDMLCFLPEDKVEHFTHAEMGAIRKAQLHSELEAAEWKHKAKSWRYPVLGCGLQQDFADSETIASCGVSWGWRLTFFD